MSGRGQLPPNNSSGMLDVKIIREITMLPVIFSEEFLEHDTGKYHPERAERLVAIVETLQKAPWKNQLQWLLPTPIDTRDVLTWVQKIHAQDYIEQVGEIAAKGGGRLDLDTPVSSRSYEIALLAVSAWLDGVDRVGEINNPVFVLARPPRTSRHENDRYGFLYLLQCSHRRLLCSSPTGFRKSCHSGLGRASR